ncbi:MAG: hypothetical protein II132_09260 [Desulfovibrio sp.]|nr:hypothetical protein [Desulfovibrio sp.]
MKQLLVPLLCLLSMGSAGSALADVHEFGPAAARFTIDVPKDWQATPTPSGVDLADRDKTTFLSINVGDVKGRTADQIAQSVSTKRGFSKVAKKGPGLYTMHGEAEGDQRKALVLFVEEERYASCTMSGKDMETVAKIADSLRGKAVVKSHPANLQESSAATPAADKASASEPADASMPQATDASGEPVNP